MTIDPRHQKDENALDQELEPVRSAWNSIAKADPPDMLDQAVLNRAKRALDEPERSGGKRKTISWLGAFASAAVVVLALTVVLDPETHGPGTIPHEPELLIQDRDGTVRVQQEDEQETLPRQSRVKKSSVSAPVENIPMDAPSATQALRESAAPAMKAEEDLAEGDDTQVELPGPEAWIEQLLQLKQSRQLEMLATELARFRTVYPDHPLPPELED